MRLLEKEERVAPREIAAAILLGADRLRILGIALLGKLDSLSYSPDVESRADLTGSDVCAAAGYNPRGLVWLFQDFENTGRGDVPQLLSDHPANQNRVNALERHFREYPVVFGKFNPGPKSGGPISVPKNAAETFLH
jgi:predicted Zn-dependent protease